MIIISFLFIDVSMIRAAHVGVGLRGKEGMKAANSADYAGKFADFLFNFSVFFVFSGDSVWSYLTRVEKLKKIIIN
jgi:hypothetical protein